MRFHLKQSLPLALLLSTTLFVQSCTKIQKVTTPAFTPTPVAAPNEFTVFYDSDPPGATLYENVRNNKLGETPFWLIYEIAEKERIQGVVYIDPTWIAWPSGATATNHPGLIFALKDGLQQTYTFVRPDVKGSEDDYVYGLNKVMKRYTFGEYSSTSK